MSVVELFTGAAYVLLAVVGWFLKDALDSVKHTKDGLAAFKTEVAKEYVPRNDLREVQAEINRRFDRLEEKIDRLVERSHA
jgi:hypothetical protein